MLMGGTSFGEPRYLKVELYSIGLPTLSREPHGNSDRIVEDFQYYTLHLFGSFCERTPVNS